MDSVNFEQGTVSLQDMTLAKEARYPIFRTEPLEYIRHLYEQVDVPMEEAVEITVFTALHNLEHRKINVDHQLQRTMDM